MNTNRNAAVWPMRIELAHSVTREALIWRSIRRSPADWRIDGRYLCADTLHAALDCALVAREVARFGDVSDGDRRALRWDADRILMFARGEA